MPSLKILIPFDCRNIIFRAINISKSNIKVEYPLSNGRLVKLTFDDLKQFFVFSQTYGILMNDLNEDSKKKFLKDSECEFFCCANCLKCGKQFKDKLIVNFCTSCSKEHQIKNEKKQTDFIKKNKVKIKEFKEPEYSQFIYEQTQKKLTNPILLKFKKWKTVK